MARGRLAMRKVKKILAFHFDEGRSARAIAIHCGLARRSVAQTLERFAACGLIPTVIDQNPCAHLRMPRDMIFHGWSMRLFQAWQHSATMSS